jgi:hypothetical protein
MIMIDQSKRLSQPLPWTRSGKLAVATFVACLLLAMAGLGLHALLETPPAGERGRCVEVTFASTLGGARLHACGRRARAMCASPGKVPGVSEALRAQCRRVGFPVG